MRQNMMKPLTHFFLVSGAGFGVIFITRGFRLCRTFISLGVQVTSSQPASSSSLWEDIWAMPSFLPRVDQSGTYKSNIHCVISQLGFLHGMVILTNTFHCISMVMLIKNVWGLNKAICNKDLNVLLNHLIGWMADWLFWSRWLQSWPIRPQTKL